MALTSSSASSADDPKKSAPAADDKKADKGAQSESKSKVTPVNAAGATDPAVQQLVAEQQTALSNGDDEALQRVNDRLGEHGYK